MSLDSRLRDMLRDSSFELPGWDDPVGRVGRGIRRRRRNRLAIGMATLAVLVAVPTLLSQQSFQEQPGVSSPIAFVAGEELGPPAYLARRSPRPEAQPCVRMHEKLWLKSDWARPQVTTVMLPPDAGLERCTLRDNGQTTVTATDVTTGQRVVFTPGSATPPGAWQSPATVSPGEPARMDIIAGKDCGQRYEDFELKVLGLVYELELTTDCPPSVTQWYVEPPLLNAPLTVFMKAPDTVQRGQWFDYVVTMLSTHGSYALHECPVYLERLGVKAIWRRLNCDRLRSLPANTRIQFAMRAYVPPEIPVGTTQLSWMAVMSDGEVAIAEIATDGVKVTVV
jgi:hypothetical protein